MPRFTCENCNQRFGRSMEEMKQIKFIEICDECNPNQTNAKHEQKRTSNIEDLTFLNLGHYSKRMKPFNK
jgi:hypothetical protein